MAFAGPAVYGELDGSSRPWLPFWVQGWQGLNELCLDFIRAYAGALIFLSSTTSLDLAIATRNTDWQLGSSNISWSAAPARQTDLVDPARLPAEWSGLTHPDSWNMVLTMQFAKWIWAGQTGILEPCLRFQLLASGDDEDDTPLCLTAHPDSTLKYGPDARLFVRRLMQDPQLDPLMCSELAAHLPPIIEDVTAMRPFLDSDYMDLLALVEDNPIMSGLIEAVHTYEEYGPIQVGLNHYASGFTDLTRRPLLDTMSACMTQTATFLRVFLTIRRPSNIWRGLGFPPDISPTRWKAIRRRRLIPWDGSTRGSDLVFSCIR